MHVVGGLFGVHPSGLIKAVARTATALPPSLKASPRGQVRFSRSGVGKVPAFLQAMARACPNRPVSPRPWWGGLRRADRFRNVMRARPLLRGGRTDGLRWPVANRGRCGTGHEPRPLAHGGSTDLHAGGRDLPRPRPHGAALPLHPDVCSSSSGTRVPLWVRSAGRPRWLVRGRLVLRCSRRAASDALTASGGGWVGMASRLCQVAGTEAD